MATSTPPSGSPNGRPPAAGAEATSWDVELLRVLVSRKGSQVEAQWAIHPQLKQDLLPHEWQEVTDLTERELSAVRKKVQLVFQSGALFGSTQALSQAGAFKPDLVIVAYGMNDRADKRRATYKQDMENIIDTIHQASPETEFIAIASMMNNPKQPVGSEPIFALRDLLLSIDRPNLAFVDMTTTHQKLIERKNYLDTSGNGANHPNDFLHRIYAMRLLELLGPTPAK